MEEKKNPSFRGILVEFMGYTTGHGFGRLVAATTFVWRIFWTLAILGASAMFAMEVMNLFKLYLSRPVQTSVTVTFEKQLKFPAVTICNLNIIKRSSMIYLPDEFKENFNYNYSYYGYANVEDKKNTTAYNTKTPQGLVSISEKPTEAFNTTEKPNQVVSTTEKPNVVVNGTGTPTEAIKTTGKPNVVVNSTETPTEAVNVTEKPATGLTTTGKPTTDLGTTSKPERRRKREEKKEESKTDGNSDSKESDGNSDTGEYDGKSDTGEYDGKSYTGAYDGKSDTGAYDGKSDTGTDKNADNKDGNSDYKENYSGDSGSGKGNDDYYYDDKGYYDDYYDEWKKDEYYDDEYLDEENVDKETKLRMKVESYIGGESPEFLNGLGHKQTDLIRDCAWKGVDCITGNLSMFWKWSWNYRYGNCYTFNDGVDDNKQPLRILKSSKSGPSQGLVLQLAIEEGEYIGELTEEAGVRVLLHEPGAMPFPFEEGFSVAPGMATSIGLTKTLIKRLDRFENGSCSEDGVPLREDNLYRKHKNITRYSLQACLNSCLGESQLARCKCAEASYPSGKEEPCDVFDKYKRKCLQRVKFLFSKDQLPCIDKCKRPCREQIYEKTISSSQWPSSARSAYLASLDVAAPNKSNGLLLNIFYSQLNFQIIEETFSYGTTNLLADIGGQLGLWIGISALTCGEVLELIFQYLVLAYTKIKNRRQNRVVEIGQTIG